MLRMSQEGFCRLRLTLTNSWTQMGRKENTSLLPCPNPEGDPRFSQEGSVESIVPAFRTKVEMTQ